MTAIPTPCAARGAITAWISVDDTTVKLVTGIPISTWVVPMKLVPVMVTVLPLGPEVGVNEVIVGAAAYVNAPASVAVPPAVVTLTLTAPAGLAGVVAVIWVAELTVKLVAAVTPKLTALAPVKLVPVIVTVVPPTGWRKQMVRCCPSVTPFPTARLSGCT